MAKFSASIKINVKEGFSKAAQKMKGASDRLGRSFDKTNRTAKKFTHGLDRLGKRALIGVGAGFAASAVKGANFQTAMQDLSSLTGLTGTTLDEVGDDALELSKKFGVSAAKITEGVKLVGSARSELLKQPEALLAITEQALILSKAARIDLASAVDSVTTSMNQFGLETADSSRVINVLAAGAKVGASEIVDTAKAIERSGVAMKLANVSFEEGNAAIQVLAKSGIKGERAGTGLKTALLKLSSSKIDAINPTVVGLATALDNLASADLNAEESTKLFGLEAIAVGKVLIDNRKLLVDWRKEMTGTDTAMTQAATNMDTVAERAKRFGRVIDDQLIGVFTDNESELSGTLDRLLTDFEKFKPVEQIFGGIATSLSNVIKATEGMSSTAGAIVGAIVDPDVTAVGDKRNKAQVFVDQVRGNLRERPAGEFDRVPQQGSGNVNVRVSVDQYGQFSATAEAQGPGLTAEVAESRGYILP